MKTKTVGSRLVILAIAMTAALVTQPMRAGAINDLVITEFSSTSLTATLNNNPLTVTPGIADNWTIALGGVSGASPGAGAAQFWTEPAAGFVNSVSFINQVSGLLFVASDSFPGQSGLADGTTDTSSFKLNGGALSVTFFDRGDVATVPDTGTTASLLGLSLTGLAFLRRKVC
jgi:hypothetical protein